MHSLNNKTPKKLTCLLSDVIKQHGISENTIMQILLEQQRKGNVKMTEKGIVKVENESAETTTELIFNLISSGTNRLLDIRKILEEKGKNKKSATYVNHLVKKGKLVSPKRGWFFLPNQEIPDLTSGEKKSYTPTIKKPKENGHCLVEREVDSVHKFYAEKIGFLLKELHKTKTEMEKIKVEFIELLDENEKLKQQFEKIKKVVADKFDPKNIIIPELSKYFGMTAEATNKLIEKSCPGLI